MKQFIMIAAMDLNRGIGAHGTLPWHVPEDMRFFKEMTLSGGGKNAVIMGRRTWESIPEKFRPLVGRMNIVLTRHPDHFLSVAGCETARSLEEAVNLAEASGAAEIFVIGGALVFAEAIELSNCKELILTIIDAEFECDVFFPDYSKRFMRQESLGEFHSKNYSGHFLKFARIP
jgi:dihydrofolate reductase